MTKFMQNRYNRFGEGTNAFALECGHLAYAKHSQGFPNRKRCRECGNKERMKQHNEKHQLQSDRGRDFEQAKNSHAPDGMDLPQNWELALRMQEVHGS